MWILLERDKKTKEITNKYEVKSTKITLLEELGLVRSERAFRHGGWVKPHGNNCEFKWEETNSEDVVKIKNEEENTFKELAPITADDILKKITSTQIKDSKVNQDVKKCLLFGDTHFNLEHKPSISILKQIASEYDFDEIVSGGDGVDFGELSTYEFLEDVDNNFRKEKVAYEAFLFELKSLQPNAKFVELYSNHFDDRAFRVSRTGDFKKYGMQEQAYEMFTNLTFPFDYRTKNALEKYYPLEQNRIGFIHGVKHGDHVAKATGLALGNSDIGFFHTHQTQLYSYTNEVPGRHANKFYALPCMCKKDLKYRRNNPSRWSNGFAILTYYQQTGQYSIEHIIVENNHAIYRDKIYNGGSDE